MSPNECQPSLNGGEHYSKINATTNPRSRVKAATFQEHSSGYLRLALVLVASTVGLFHPPPTEAGSFVPTGSLATPRDGFTATLLPNGKVLIAGGYDGTNQLSGAELYDPVTGTWAATGAMHSRRSVHTATLLPNGKVLVAGGYDGTNGLTSAEMYNPATGTWVATGSMTGSRATHTATLLPNGNVLVTGGEGNASPFSAELYDLVTGTWTATGGMSAPRSEHTATLLPNGRVLVAGGGWYRPIFGYSSMADAELYDPVTRTWSSTAAMAGSRFGHTATLLPNGQVLIAGGVFQGFGAGTLSSAELYAPASGTWTSAGNMTVARLYHSATLLASGQVLIAAGFNYTHNDLLSAELYDALQGGTRNWTPTGSLLTARMDHTATPLTNGQALVAGGMNGVTNSLSSAERYDPNSGTWTATGSMNSPRQNHTATLLQNGLVLAAGGYDGVDLTSAAELYNPSAQTWTGTGWMNLARTRHSANLLKNGQILVAGGYDGGASTSSAELYDPVTEGWSQTGSLNASRESHTVTLLADGRVLVAGGWYSDGVIWAPIADAEVYDPVSGTWAVTGSMGFARVYHTATLLPNGKVLVAGGRSDSANYLADAEVYDPATETWTTTGSMTTNRSEHTATLLANGKVLVAGGNKGSTIGLPSADLYDPLSGLWTTATPLNSGRWGHTAILLPNGQVLAAGGYNQNISQRYLSTAELYDGSAGAPGTRLTNPRLLPNGSFQFSFTNTPGATFSVLASTNVVLAWSNWTLLGNATEIAPSQFQFTDNQATNYARRFYRTRSP